jgi:CCR4-NOT transcription complex subunit 10
LKQQIPTTPSTTTSNENQLLLLNKIQINNNISCIYYYTKKFNLSSFYLRRAIQDNNKFLNDIKTVITKTPSSSTTTNLINLYTRNINYKYELLFNLGITLLYNKQPLQSFDCFIELLTSTFKYSTNIRLWLRLAECCIMVYRKNEDLYKLSEKVKCIQKSIGMHIYHKIVFNTRLTKSTIQPPQQDQTLEFAYMCLKNALHLLNLATPNGTNSELREKLIDCCQPATAITLNEFYRLKCSILISLSYVSLCLNDYLNTIYYCNILLNDCKNFMSKGNKLVSFFLS